MHTVYHFVFLSTGICSAKREGNATIPECSRTHRAGLALIWVPELTLAPFQLLSIPQLKEHSAHEYVYGQDLVPSTPT